MPIWKTNSTHSKTRGLKNATPLGKNLLFSEATYKFNGKMKDPETGNYYYGARYYNPKWSIWLSVDPLAHKYPAMSPYAYTLWNPVKYVDPDGRKIIIFLKNNDGKWQQHVYQYGQNYKGNNQFVSDVYKSLNYILNNGADKKGIIKYLACNTKENNPIINNLYKQSYFIIPNDQK